MSELFDYTAEAAHAASEARRYARRAARSRALAARSRAAAADLQQLRDRIQVGDLVDNWRKMADVDDQAAERYDMLAAQERERAKRYRQLDRQERNRRRTLFGQPDPGITDVYGNTIQVGDQVLVMVCDPARGASRAVWRAGSAQVVAVGRARVQVQYLWSTRRGSLPRRTRVASELLQVTQAHDGRPLRSYRTYSSEV